MGTAVGVPLYLLTTSGCIVLGVLLDESHKEIRERLIKKKKDPSLKLVHGQASEDEPLS